MYLANNLNTVLFCNYGSSANQKAQFIKGKKKRKCPVATLCWMIELDEDGDADAEQVSYADFFFLSLRGLTAVCTAFCQN